MRSGLRSVYAPDLVSSKQGKKGKPASQPTSQNGSRRTAGLIGFGVLLIVLFAWVALAQGIGEPSVPEGDIAVVEDAPDGTITAEEYDGSLEQTAAAQGLQEVPAEDDPQFELLRSSAISDLILSRWVAGEAEERGIEITDREIDDELAKVKEEQFGSDKAFEKFLEDSGFTLDEARDRIRLQLISDRIQTAVLPEEPEVTDAEIETFYDENIDQFEQPETRDVRVILTETQADADKAKAALEKDATPKGFEEVARKYSIDEATKTTGGLREAVVAGQSEPALDTEIFRAPEGELVGPFETDAGFYLIQVEAITPASTTPLDPPGGEPADPADPAAGAREQIRQTLIAARQQEMAQAFQEDFSAKWKARTFCGEGYEVDRCSNAPAPPNPCTEKVAESTGCGAPVPSRKIAGPGTRGVFGSPAAALLPQGPQAPTAAAAAGGLPPGLVPTGPGGQVPQGAAPQQAPPQGAAPVPPG